MLGRDRLLVHQLVVEAVGEMVLGLWIFELVMDEVVPVLELVLVHALGLVLVPENVVQLLVLP